MITGLGSRSGAATAQLSAVTSREQSPKACGIASSRPISPLGACWPVLVKEHLLGWPIMSSTSTPGASERSVILRTSSFGWKRVYWHSHENNYGARMLYDRLIPRTDYVRYDIDL